MITPEDVTNCSFWTSLPGSEATPAPTILSAADGHFHKIVTDLRREYFADM